MRISFAQTNEEILACLETVQALRPHITDAGAFLAQVKEMKSEGYKMLYVALEEDGKENVVAFAGFRPMLKLHRGPIIYIDDLSTHPAHRGKGYAGRLLDKIHELAKAEGKIAVELDSGYQRTDAHRLYLNKKYTLASHHFALEINKNILS
ncbi:MAG: GNAT family N-acetyltransferase [Chitinophaga rupis]